MSKHLLAVLVFLSACAGANSDLNYAKKTIDSLGTAFAPDKRVALFNVEARVAENRISLIGESNLPDALASLKATLKRKGIIFMDSVQVLPEKELGDKIYGVVKISVANLRSGPKHSAELSTQATLGTPLNVLKKQGEWYFVQTPDGYLSWVDQGGFELLNVQEFQEWRDAEKLIYLNPYGFALEQPEPDGPTVSDVVMGNIFQLLGEAGNFYHVKYPDGMVAYIPKDQAQLYNTWKAALMPSGSSIVKTALTMKGVPYLWGGTSPKGVDCSGFTKVVYFMNGIVIPRDASQQVNTGALIDSVGSFDELQAGDLLFFGTPRTDSTKERVVHVGVWVGNKSFVHSSGKVHISSMDSTAENFDQFNYNRYLKTKRLLNKKETPDVSHDGHVY